MYAFTQSYEFGQLNMLLPYFAAGSGMGMCEGVNRQLSAQLFTNATGAKEDNPPFQG